jgi:plasmid stability protein
MATVQIRNLDNEAYGVLKTRAASSGRSMQEYLRLLLEKEARVPERQDTFARFRADFAWPGTPITTEEILEVIHQGREER